MTRVALFHWDRAEGARRADELRAKGFEVDACSETDGKGLTKLRGAPPDAIVIDLSRLPSQGRQVAVFLRQRAWARGIPLVLAGGAPDKVVALREVLPDATYAEPKGLAAAIRRALAAPRAKPVVPSSIGGYSGTPLPRKLGIKPGTTVVLLGAPEDFATTLGELPAGARLAVRGAGERVLLFCRTLRDLERRFERATASVAEAGALWIVWPKLGSPLAADLREPLVREHGLARKWVDYKICAIDGTWSGLCFARRKAK